MTLFSGTACRGAHLNVNVDMASFVNEANRAQRMTDLWEAEIGHSLMHGALNMVQITLACALGLEARNPDFLWRSRHPKLRERFDQIAARSSFKATAPPSAS